MITMFRLFLVSLVMLLTLGVGAASAQDNIGQSSSDTQSMQHRMHGQGMHQGMDGYCPKTASGMPCPHCPKQTAMPCPNCPKQTGMPCPNCPKLHGSAHGMQGGMMMGGMDKDFFLDRRDELDLSMDQVEKLIQIRSSCKADNIRNMAEVKIAHMQITDLLSGNDWTVEQAEELVRKVQQLKGDIAIRHLQAKKDALNVLSEDQREKIADGSANLEELFQ